MKQVPVFLPLLLLPLLLLSILSTSRPATALPNGAPRCKINVTVITQGHERAMGALGFQMSAPATYTPGGAAVPITVTGLTAFTRGGVLAYVKQVTNANAAAGFSETHVGKFDIATNGLRAQTVASCQMGTVMNEAPESTVTHAAPVPSANLQSFTWTPPATDAGAVQVNIVIATGTEGTPWMQLAPVTIMSTGGGAAAPAPAPAPSSSSVSAKTTTTTTTTTVSTRTKSSSSPAPATPTPTPTMAPAPAPAAEVEAEDGGEDDFAAAGAVGAVGAVAGAVTTGAGAAGVIAQVQAVVAEVKAKIAAAQALVQNAQMLALADAKYVVGAMDPTFDQLMGQLNAVAGAVAAL
ncbi:hypothetical protein DFJ73DRAFT_782798 [Zopfochytrium polystomum]|nr:hypothetical protein DFJ73DRAFT_782798 [Zopfochytrium polystomum]